MKIVIIGCTLTTLRCLEELARNKEDHIALVLTLDSSLRKSKSRFASLRAFTTLHQIPIQEITDINDPFIIETIQNLSPDVIFEIGWSQRIGRAVLDIPDLGCIGIHDSLLPKYQGAASLNWALIWGEHVWGISLFYLEEDFDKGDIIGQRSYAIDEDDDINSAFDKADGQAVDLLHEMVPKIRNGTAPRMHQDPSQVTRTRRRKPQDGVVDWSQPNRNIYNLVRALKKPYPPAFTYLRGQTIYILDSRTEDIQSQGPGVVQSISSRGLIIGTGNQSLLVLTLQLEKGDEMDAMKFGMNQQLSVGDHFGS